MPNMTMGGLTLVLHAMVFGQLLTGVPLLLPVKFLQKPSLFVMKYVRSGPGFYVVSTLGACVSLLFCTSAFEVYRLDHHGKEADTSVESSLVAVQKSAAHLNVILCLFAMTLGVILPRLSNKISAHDSLKGSHDALKKQAAGLSAEYSRATSTSPASGTDSSTKTLQQQVDELSAQLKEAVAAQHKAEVSLEGMKSQTKNLESSYDALSDENRRMQVQLAQAGVDVNSKKGA